MLLESGSPLAKLKGERERRGGGQGEGREGVRQDEASGGEVRGEGKGRGRVGMGQARQAEVS